MKQKLLTFWSKVAREVAALSTCDRTQVGALLLSLDGERLLALGYNGGIRGGLNEPSAIDDVPGTDFWIHAETNALIKSRPFEPFVALVTHTPCKRCAQLLLNSQALEVYALEYYRDLAGWQLLREHGRGVLLGRP